MIRTFFRKCLLLPHQVTLPLAPPSISPSIKLSLTSTSKFLLYHLLPPHPNAPCVSHFSSMSLLCYPFYLPFSFSGSIIFSLSLLSHAFFCHLLFLSVFLFSLPISAFLSLCSLCLRSPGGIISVGGKSAQL